MCFFRRKKTVTVTIKGKYEVGDLVKFRHRGELDPGYIYAVYLNANNEVVYDVQVGGECPAIIKNVLEKDIIPRK